MISEVPESSHSEHHPGPRESGIDEPFLLPGEADVLETISCIQQGCGWFPEYQGGLERYFLELLVALPKVKVECSGLVIGSDLVAEESNGNVRAFAGHDMGLFDRWRGIRRYGSRPPSLKFCNLFVSHFSCYAFPVLQQIRDRPMVVHFHGPWAAESEAEGSKRLNVILKKRVETAVYRRADRLITLSSAFRDILCQRYKVDPGRVRIVPGGVDTSRFTEAAAVSRAEARIRQGWPTDRPIVLTVRRLMGRMGLENLVDAIRIVREKHPDVLCLIAGRGRMGELLEAQIAAQGLGNHVRLLGFVPDTDLPFAYRAADFTIVPSVSLEGFGLSAVESLAAGTPALVTPVGGLPEVVTNLDPQLVLPGFAPKSLADGMLVALNRLEALPDDVRCSSYALREFDWTNVSRRIRGVYEEALH